MSFISKISLSLASAAALFVCSSCLNEDFAGKSGDGSDRPVDVKIINSPANSVQGQLLVCLGEGETEKESVLSQLSSQMQIKSFEKIFPAEGHNAKYLKKYGLDRWYLLEFDGCGTEAAAETAEAEETPAE